jgi:dihydroorotase
MASTSTSASTLITGGSVVDVDTGRVTRANVLIRDGRIASLDAGNVSADRTIDADGSFVAPGFIDLHTHVFDHPLFATGRVPADRIGVQQGVACVVDAGSSGASTIDAFPEFVHRTQATRAYAFINIGSPGLPNLGGGHASRPDLCDLPGVVDAFDRHGDWLVGVKVLASTSHTGSFGLEAAKLARKAAELVGRPLMLHVGNAPPLIDDVLDLLRPGDIVTHIYHGKVGGVLTRGDKILPAFRAAIERGVIADIGHGRSSFSFRVCEAALSQGMPVHTISSDLHRGNLERYGVSLARTMTKLRAIGLSSMEVLRAVTIAPATAIGLHHRGFGRLTVNGPAHITLYRERHEPQELEDAEGEKRTAHVTYEPIGVLVDGEYHERTARL